MIRIGIIAFTAALFVSACGSTGEKQMTEATYEMITGEEAQQAMERDSGYIILDVRTKEEYDAGHIKGAICIPVETIGGEAPEELPDKDQTIYVYCRSGNRSKTASAKLVDLGYTNIIEFGGVNTWPGELVTE